MNFGLRRFSWIASLLVLLAFAHSAAPVQRAQFLTQETSSEDAASIALAYVRNNLDRLGLSGGDIAEIALTDRATSGKNGVTNLYFRQRFRGIEVVNGDMNVNVSRDGRIINLRNEFVRRLSSSVNATRPGLAAVDAVRRAAEQLGLTPSGPIRIVETIGGFAREVRLSPSGLSLEEIPAKLVFYRTESGQARLAWDLVLRLVDQSHWWHLWVDASNGAILDRADWIAHDNYEVFAVPLESPDQGPRTIEMAPADSLASPFGWHDTSGAPGAEFTDTRGNNVHAQEDTDANNSGGFRPDGGPGLSFQFPLNLALEPSQYQEAAITNLFFWNNILHDVFYQYGFDEASGNFQQNNYGRFTNFRAANDPVQADAQDGSGTNNASFEAPPDGQAPRMQMFVWTPDPLVVTPGGSFVAASVEFGPPLDETGITAEVKLADDGTGTTTDGCEAFAPGFFSDAIALIDRGTCDFVTKVKNAQNAGALAGIVANNQGDGLLVMVGEDPTIAIPSVFIGQSDGTTLKQALPLTATIKVSSIPNRDSDLDNGVIAHEYGHGVSIRLTGGRRNSSCLFAAQSRGMGEGWSDFWALVFTAKATDEADDPRGVGNYVTFQPPDGPGIRVHPYTVDMSVNPLTYENIDSLSVPHGVGTVWNTALWEVYWNLVGKYGFDANLYTGSGGNNLAIQLVIDGMKLQGCRPTFLVARDAILLADQANHSGANQCEIWQGFAKRGMGVNALDGGSPRSVDVTNDFSVPDECTPAVTELSGGDDERSIGRR